MWGGVSGDAGAFDGISVALIAPTLAWACACASRGSSTRLRSSFAGERTAGARHRGPLVGDEGCVVLLDFCGRER